MSDFVISQIRTYVPVLVGAIVAFLVAQGILDEESALETNLALTTALTAVATGVYYFLVRWLAERWSWIGVLLGYNKKPAYYQPENLGTKE